ncbi:HD domain-containing protein [Bradyrhizobium jicamae]|uniref:HD domain-containing protein n=1 Tax=Bradyrhizobium jicamae TaxID=280332 RepID=UPI001BAC3B27|nr:HD domain-containing protein [Bradyrhizobium jicamae]
MKHNHEFRDPIHVFVTLDSDERRVVDSRPFQRLRYVHQLAASYLVFSGATHRRFEHSLGVMHLAGQVFDVVMAPENVHHLIRPEMPGAHQLGYWRRVVRLAALCHDIGHLPFSHAAEHELLPEGWNHERLSFALINSDEMRAIFLNSVPPINPDHVAKIAIGQKKLSEFAPDVSFSVWETLLSEIIVGDAFGVDRIDYLLRDAYHAGVVYGRFDHHRLLQTLRILPLSDQEGDSIEPWLGIESGGLEAAEAMSLARYFMYKQVYFHRVRRAYDIHLKDFLKDWLAGKFPTDIQEHLKLTDNEVMAALLSAARDASQKGHIHARRFVDRQHFKMLYERTPSDQKVNRAATDLLFDELVREFGADCIRRDSYTPRAASLGFPVLRADNRIESSINLSETLQKIPSATFDLILCDRTILTRATSFLKANREKIITPVKEVAS